MTTQEGNMQVAISTGPLMADSHRLLGPVPLWHCDSNGKFVPGCWCLSHVGEKFNIRLFFANTTSPCPVYYFLFKPVQLSTHQRQQRLFSADIMTYSNVMTASWKHKTFVINSTSMSHLEKCCLYEVSVLSKCLLDCETVSEALLLPPKFSTLELGIWHFASFWNWRNRTIMPTQQVDRYSSIHFGFWSIPLTTICISFSLQEKRNILVYSQVQSLSDLSVVSLVEPAFWPPSTRNYFFSLILSALSLSFAPVDFKLCKAVFCETWKTERRLKTQSSPIRHKSDFESSFWWRWFAAIYKLTSATSKLFSIIFSPSMRTNNR